MTSLTSLYLNGEISLLMLTALATGGTFLLGLFAFGDVRDRLSRRVSMVREAAAAPREALSAKRDLTSLRRRDRSALATSALARMISLMPRITNLQLRLNRSGLNIAASDIVIFGLTGALLVTGLTYLMLLLSLPLALAIGVICGLVLPHLFISWRINRRQRRFVLCFPDAIDLIVRGVRSGLPVAEAIQSAGREGDPVIADVFTEITGNLQLGMSLEEAMWAVARRLENQEFNFFVISLSIQQETGGNLAEILSNLSRMMRRREQVKMKIRAMSSEAKASAMIIGSLPFIMMLLLYMINKDYILTLFINPKGWVLLGAAVLSMSIGALIMARMVRFEV